MSERSPIRLGKCSFCDQPATGYQFSGAEFCNDHTPVPPLTENEIKIARTVIDHMDEHEYVKNWFHTLIDRATA